MAYTGTSYEHLYKWGYYAAIACVVALIFLFQPFATPEPPNIRAHGCYIADDAPAIRLDQHGINIQQPGFPRIGFHLERHKTAITLTTEAPIDAKLVGNRYAFSIYQPGEGTFLDFQHVVNGRRYGQFDEKLLSMFVMLADDGHEIIYQKASPDRC